jgi:hypothetical protein
MKRIALAIMLVGCASGEEIELGCTFEGRYELGFLPTNGCNGRSVTLLGTEVQEECYSSASGVNLEGVAYVYTISCAPGDPVVECEGFGSYANGCEYDLYMRRLTAP